MASIRQRGRADGSIAYAVLYKLDGVQTAATFDDEQAAVEFRDAVNSIGAERAMRGWGIAPTNRAKRPSGPTVEQWCRTYIDSRTGVTKATLYDYELYLRKDIAPVLGALPITVLSRDDVAEWVQGLEEREPPLAGKTIVNRHGFLSAALNYAVRSEEIPSNPAAGTRLPRSEKAEMSVLTSEEFTLFLECFTPHWRPVIEFLAVSGTRFGEMSALKPSDVDRKTGTVWVGRSRKRTYDEDKWEVGPTKTKKSERTINVDPAVLAELDYSGEWLFLNTVGKPLTAPSFRNNVWYPALDRAGEKGLTKRPRIHDMRHTCASWMIAAGVPMPVVQAHLGHENISTTISLYTHLDRSSGQAAAEAIGRSRR